MAENSYPQEYSELESRLGRVYSSPTPDPLFAARLEQQLIARAAVLQPARPARLAARPGFFALLTRRAVLVGIATVLVLLLVSIGLIGPQKVLAEVQRLLGYQPSVGFVQPGQSLYLPAPVEARQGGYTLRVSSVVVDQTSTRIIFTVTGLPQVKFDSPAAAQTGMYLLLPGGVRLDSTESTVGIGEVLQASAEFPPLPAGVDRVTLVLPRLPGFPAGMAPENWSVALALQPVSATPSQASGATQPSGLVQPYTPENAIASGRGVTVSVLQVGQSAQEVGLQVQYTWQNPDWTQLSGNPGSLSDDLGRQFVALTPPLGDAFAPDPGSNAPELALRTLRFAAQAPSAGKLTLTIDQLVFNVRQDVSFAFDPGRNPQVGQIWDLSQTPGMEQAVAGIPFKILSASLEKVQKILGDTNPKDVYQLILLVQTTPQDGLALQNVNLQLSSQSGGSSLETLPGGQFRLALDLPALPAGPLTLHIPQATITVAGPWQIDWTAPRK